MRFVYHSGLHILCCAAFALLHSTASTAAGVAELESYTYSLTQSTPGYQFWTAPPSRRVFKDDTPPEETDTHVRLYAAANEFEPFQLVIKPSMSSSVTVNMGDFGEGIEAEIFQVKYVDIDQASDNLGRLGPYPDPLWPVEQGGSVSLTAGENTALWILINVTQGTPMGDYAANVTIGGMNIPVQLHVFNFAIPASPSVKSQMNFNHNNILSKYSVSGTGANYWMYVEMMKQFFIDHRLTPKSALWSGGLTSSGGASYIDFDCDTGTLSDPHGIWGFEEPAARYLAGTGLMSGEFGEVFNNGSGFPSFMAVTFQNNDASADQRPSTFCTLSRSAADWYTANNPTSQYNQAWFNYMANTEDYLQSLGYLGEAYYYFANEPQDQADYDAVAWYSRYLKNSAPNLKLMVSEEPKPEIFDHPDYVHNHQIDVWLPVLHQYDPVVSQERAVNHREESWIYFLHGTRPPYFNPITLDHPGIESKLTGWFLWKFRLRGIAYYSMNNWSINPWTDPMVSNHNGDWFMLYPPSETNSNISFGANNHRLVPSIRLELMRDSLEDYEYLYLLNSGQHPVHGQANASDQQSDKIITGLTSYSRDDEFIYNLRRLIGLKNGGEIAEIPDIQPPPLHPRAEGQPASYYINFQNPNGEPSAEPLIVHNHEYMKIGWNTYDQQLGYGWYGDMANVMYRYLSSGPNELQKSIIYDDWGRQKTFDFDLPNGTYRVTVSAGWEGRTYSHNYIAVEGVVFIDDETTSPYIERTLPVTVSDNKLTLAMGIFDEYTMLNYLQIETASPIGDFSAIPLSGFAPLEVSFTDQTANTPTSWQWDFDSDSSIDATTSTPDHTYSTAGTYSVSLTVANSFGSNTVVKNAYIRIYQRGDVDCDDTLGLSDMVGLLQILVGSQASPNPGCPQSSGDLDGDGYLGMGDSIGMLQMLAEP